MRVRLGIIIFTLLPGVLVMAQRPEIYNVWDWDKLCNSYIDNGNNISVSSVWLYNGNLVEKGWGNIVVRREADLCDTIPFLFMAGTMVFHETDYRKFPSPQIHANPAGVNVVRENLGDIVAMHLCFFHDLSKNDSLIKHFEGRFPSEWLISSEENNIMHNPIFRITELNNGYYLIDLSTYGAYLTYNMTSGLRFYKKCSDRKKERLHKKLLRKHKSIYGRNIYHDRK